MWTPESVAGVWLLILSILQLHSRLKLPALRVSDRYKHLVLSIFIEGGRERRRMGRRGGMEGTKGTRGREEGRKGKEEGVDTSMHMS